LVERVKQAAVTINSRVEAAVSASFAKGLRFPTCFEQRELAHNFLNANLLAEFLRCSRGTNALLRAWAEPGSRTEKDAI